MKLQNRINELAEDMNDADILMNIRAISVLLSDAVDKVIRNKAEKKDDLKEMLYHMGVLDLNIRMFRQNFPEFSAEMDKAINFSIDCYRAESKDEPEPEGAKELLDEITEFFNRKGFKVKVTTIKADKED